MKLRILDAVNKGSEITIYLGLPDVEPTGDDWEDAPWDCNAGTVYEKYIIASLHILLNDDMWVDEVNTSCCKEDIFNNGMEILRVGSHYESEKFLIKLGKTINFNPKARNIQSVYYISDFERFLPYAD